MKSVSIGSKKISMAVGESVPLDYSTTPSGNWSRTVSGFYAMSSDTSVVTIGDDMILTAVGEGAATITIGTDTGLTATCQVMVGSVGLEDCEVTLASSSYAYDGTAKKPAVTVICGGTALEEGTDYSVSYSNNTKVGTATVTVTGMGDYTGTQTVNFTIEKASQTLTVSSSSVSLAVGGTSTLTASGAKTTLSYSSSDTSVATVSSAGKITAKKVGTAVITVAAAASANYNKATKTVKVTVKPASTTVSSVTNTTSGVKVTWKKVTGATGYYVYRAMSKSGTYTKIATIESGSTVSYTNGTSGTYKVTSGKTYYYKVYAYASTGTSAASSTKSIRFLTAGKISSLTNTSGGITIKWSKVSGASGYYVYRKTGSGSYSNVKTVTSGSTVSYSDTAVKSKNGTTYTYYVIPYYKNSSGTVTKGSYSNTKKMVRMTAVSLSSVKNSSSKKMTVKWAKNSKATGYQIQYSTSSSFASGNKTVTVSGTSSSSKVISSLTKNKTYYVRVRSYKTVSGTKYYSAWSGKKSVKISK